MQTVTGAMSALITPFKNGKVDRERYIRLIKRQIENGMDAVVPVGTTGESATLSHDEHRECIEIAVDTCKDSGIKVLAGAGSNSTEEAKGLARFAQKSGADGILSVTPYYNKPTQEGLYQHYKALAGAVDLPLMLYNVPGRTGVSLSSETIIRLYDDVPNIYGVKEASGSIEKVVELNKRRPELAIVSGEDAINYPILANGGVGCISVTGNLLPDLISRLVRAVAEYNHKEAKKLNDTLFEINRALFVESNPIPIKAAMYEKGLLESLEYRLPLLPPAESSLRKIKEALALYEVVE